MIKALRNLQTALDEGFVTKQEYEKRRKTIIDGATALPNEPRAAKGKAAKGGGSVFDRLGEVEAGVDGSSWGHGGYNELYGSGAARGKQERPKSAKGGRTVVTKANGGDLRDRLSGGGGGIRKPVRGRGGAKSLPEQCPW
tara:strand:- start:275 stop:694 length:420 start_codon:yes stop_codon:yes gene_type:complete